MVEWTAGLVWPQLAERSIQQTVWMMTELHYELLVLQVGWLVAAQLVEVALLQTETDLGQPKSFVVQQARLAALLVEQLA
jgi:hypothetical protein